MIDTDALCSETTDLELWSLMSRAARRHCREAAARCRCEVADVRRRLSPLQRRLEDVHEAQGAVGGPFSPSAEALRRWADDFDALGVAGAPDALRALAALPDHVRCRPLHPDRDDPARACVEAFDAARDATLAAIGSAIRADPRAAFAGLEVAASELLEEQAWHRAQSVLPDQVPALAAWPGLTRHAITLIGCPVFDLMQLPNLLPSRGFAVHAPDRVRAGDHVVFCVNSCFGPSPRTEAAVRACAGLDVRLVALVHTDADAVNDESLFCLVEMEMRELIAQSLPREDIEALPFLMDFDPLLREKLVARIETGIAAMRCAE